MRGEKIFVTPRTWLGSAPNFAKTRFKRFRTFRFSTPKKNFRRKFFVEKFDLRGFGVVFEEPRPNGHQNQLRRQILLQIDVSREREKRTLTTTEVTLFFSQFFQCYTHSCAYTPALRSDRIKCNASGRWRPLSCGGRQQELISVWASMKISSINRVSQKMHPIINVLSWTVFNRFSTDHGRFCPF